MKLGLALVFSGLASLVLGRIVPFETSTIWLIVMICLVNYGVVGITFGLYVIFTAEEL